MRIHHFTVPALEPVRVARVLAEVLGARVIPLPHPVGTLLVYADDTDGTAIEVWPAATRAGVGDRELALTDLPLPDAWPHHAYITSDACDAEGILAAFAREGWKAESVHNGPPRGGFGLVRGWIENQVAIEIGGSDMRAEYERFFREVVARSVPARAEAEERSARAEERSARAEERSVRAEERSARAEERSVRVEGQSV